MAASAQSLSLPSMGSRRIIDFLKAELKPRPGMYATLTRVLITVIITFLIAATFRMPYAAITLYSVFTIDRSSRRAAVRRSLESIFAITVGVVLALMDVMLFAQLPMLTFVAYAAELFFTAFVIRTTRLQGPGMNMGLAIYSVHNAWERPYPAGAHIEQTLWVWLTLCLGFAVSVAVEFALVREEPLAQIKAQLKARLRALSSLLTSLAESAPNLVPASDDVLSFAHRGTAAIREQIVLLRNTDPALHDQLLAFNTLTALVARVVDISATIDITVKASEEDASRLRDLAAELERLRYALDGEGSIDSTEYHPAANVSERAPWLPELERTVALMPSAFSASASQDNDPAVQLLDTGEQFRLFVPDAFTNPGYLLFALKTMFAAMLCYITYSALAWPGISTSVVTCLVTGLNTVGATKQKQMLRLSGAVFGGLLALGAVAILLPEMDSITSVTLLVAAVSAFSGWFTLGSPRLSYFGLQTALAFYLALLQDYSATTRLDPARDRAFGVVLGLAMMWLVFDNLWPVLAADHMRTGLAENLRLVARLVTALDGRDRVEAIQTIRGLRDQIQQGLAAVHGHADSVLFEVGSRERKVHLALRDAILRLQATLRTLFVVEIAICQYRTQVVPGTRPAEIGAAMRQLDEALSRRLVVMAESVEGLRELPDEPPLNEILERFEAVAGAWEQSLQDEWIKSRISGIRALAKRAVELTESLRSELFPVLNEAFMMPPKARRA